MKWGIFGKKKLNDKITDLNQKMANLSLDVIELNKIINRFGKKTDAIIETQSELTEKIKLLSNDINKIGENQSDLAGKFDRLIDELKKLQEMAKIPVVKPFIRDPEKTYNEERKKDEENYAHNLWRI